jgi:hypothetical protein
MVPVSEKEKGRVAVGEGMRPTGGRHEGMQTIGGVDKNVRKLDSHVSQRRVQNGAATVENATTALEKAEHRVNIRPSNSTPGIWSGGLKPTFRAWCTPVIPATKET